MEKKQSSSDSLSVQQIKTGTDLFQSTNSGNSFNYFEYRFIIYFRNAINKLKEKLGRYWLYFGDEDRDIIENQNEKLKGLNSNDVKEMFEGASLGLHNKFYNTDQDKLIDFEQFTDVLKNIQIIPIKPNDY